MPEGANDTLALPGATAATQGPSPLFTRLELLVIDMGERDALLSISRGRWGRLRAKLSGIEPPRAFADSRLEALRVLVIALRHQQPPDAALGAAVEAGITEAQIDYLRFSASRN